MQYWLMKSEGDSYSIDDLQSKKVDAWDGVRNYQARNFMQAMRVGDGVLFYHSGKSPSVAGVAKVATVAHPDHTQFDPKSPYFDSKATQEKPIWFCVDVKFVKKFKIPITLEQIKKDKKLSGMRVREVGSRLSVQPVSKEHFEHVLTLGQ